MKISLKKIVDSDEQKEETVSPVPSKVSQVSEETEVW